MSRHPRRATTHEWRSGAAAATVLVVLWGIPLGLGAWAGGGAKQEERDATSGSMSGEVTVGSRAGAPRQAVDLVEQVGPRPEASGQATGTITSIEANVGDSIALGQRLLSVDDRPVLALVGETPLYRDLQVGDDGHDVLVLGRLLSAAGYLDVRGVTSSFGADLDTAVRRFNAESGQPENGTFAAARAMYVPDDFGRVREVLVRLGQVVGGSWSALAGTESVESVSIEAPADGPPVTALGRGRSVILLGSSRVAVSSLTPGKTERPALVSALRNAVTRGQITVTSDDGDTMTRRYAGGHLERGDRVSLGVVPSSALVTAPSGRHCVFARGAAAPAPASRSASAIASPTASSAAGGIDVITVARVEVDSAGIGQTLVDRSLIGKRVLRDPTVLSAEELARCR